MEDVNEPGRSRDQTLIELVDEYQGLLLRMFTFICGIWKWPRMPRRKPF